MDLFACFGGEFSRYDVFAFEEGYAFFAAGAGVHEHTVYEVSGELEGCVYGVVDDAPLWREIYCAVCWHRYARVLCVGLHAGGYLAVITQFLLLYLVFFGGDFSFYGREPLF